MEKSCFFVTDLHGRVERYQKLFAAIGHEKPGAVFLGGDLLPHHMVKSILSGNPMQDFISDFLVLELKKIKKKLGKDYPRIFVILGNDDSRFPEKTMLQAEQKGIWDYIHDRRIDWQEYRVFGYAFVPPTPFRLKDWERYDVSRYVDPGSIPLEEGMHTIPVSENQILYSTIAEDLEKLTGNIPMGNAIFLFHSPPYQTALDRVALDGRMEDHVPLDVHVGSIAIRRFIEDRQPLITLHGHIHESTKLTGSWREQIGKTWCFNAAHHGPELSLIRFDPRDPAASTRSLF